MFVVFLFLVRIIFALNFNTYSPLLLSWRFVVCLMSVETNMCSDRSILSDVSVNQSGREICTHRSPHSHAQIRLETDENENNELVFLTDSDRRQWTRTHTRVTAIYAFRDKIAHHFTDVFWTRCQFINVRIRFARRQPSLSIRVYGCTPGKRIVFSACTICKRAMHSTRLADGLVLHNLVCDRPTTTRERV